MHRIGLIAAALVGAAPQGPLTLDAIRDVVHEHRAQIKQCYERSAAKKKNLSGKLVVRFVITEQGSVGECAAKETTLADDGVSACVVAEVKTWTFPRPKHGPAAINFPFHFGAAAGGKFVPPPPDPDE